MADIREMIAQSFPDATRTYRALTDNPGAAFDGLMANLLGGGEQVRNRLYDTARTAGQSVAQFQQNPLATAQQWGARLGGDVTQQVREALNNAQAGMSVMPQVSDQATRQAIPAMLGAVTPLQTVWHGTPHRFEPVPENPLGRFDISKIGTGEGAQSYGHGLYVAEAPGVAKTYGYAGNAAYPEIYVGGRRLNPDFMRGPKGDWGIDAGDFYDITGKKFGEVAGSKAKNAVLQSAPENVRTALARIPDEQFRIVRSEGNLYKVDLPDKHIERMLDWDKPLSQQPKAVQEVLDKTPVIKTLVNNHWGKTPGEPTGEFLVKTLESNLGKEEASRFMNSQGIPGIKYLDQGSRNMPARSLSELQDELRNTKEALKNPPIYNTERFKEIANENIASLQKQIANYQKQTRNFVVFRDDILKILARE